MSVTDEQRTVVKRNSYAPFGETFAPTAIDGTGYTGHVMDQATGLTYMQARYYDPQMGRFLSTDPTPADPATGANFNSYWYANNNPYGFTDPDGRQACSDACMKQREDSDDSMGLGGGFGPGSGATAGTTEDSMPTAPLPAAGAPLPPAPPAKSVGEEIADTANYLWDQLFEKVLPALEGPAYGVASGLGSKFAAIFYARRIARNAGPVFKTTQEAARVAESLGFSRIMQLGPNGQAIFQNGKTFITRDVDGHNGGAWKVAKSIKDLWSKDTRRGTFDAKLTTRVGD